MAGKRKYPASQANLALLSEFEAGYIAGFMDGEGHVTIMRSYPSRVSQPNKHGYHSVQVVLANNKPAVLEWIQKRIGGTIYSHQPGGNRNRSFRLVLSGRNSRGFLVAIAPYLLLKREQALLALEYLDLGPAFNPLARAELCERMRTLNRRGKPEQQNGHQPDASQKTLQ